MHARRFKRYAELLSAIRNGERRYRFYRFTTQRIKILDEAKFGGSLFVTVAIRRPSTRTERETTQKPVRRARR